MLLSNLSPSLLQLLLLLLFFTSRFAHATQGNIHHGDKWGSSDDDIQSQALRNSDGMPWKNLNSQQVFIHWKSIAVTKYRIHHLVPSRLIWGIVVMTVMMSTPWGQPIALRARDNVRQQLFYQLAIT